MKARQAHGVRLSVYSLRHAHAVGSENSCLPCPPRRLAPGYPWRPLNRHWVSGGRANDLDIKRGLFQSSSSNTAGQQPLCCVSVGLWRRCQTPPARPALTEKDQDPGRVSIHSNPRGHVSESLFLSTQGTGNAVGPSRSISAGSLRALTVFSGSSDSSDTCHRGRRREGRAQEGGWRTFWQAALVNPAAENHAGRLAGEEPAPERAPPSRGP